MPANQNPIFSLTPIISQVLVTGASVTRDASGPNVYPLISGSSFGSRIERIEATATGTTIAGTLRFYLVNPFQGSLKTGLWREVSVTAATPSASVACWTNSMVRTDGMPVATLNSGASILVSTHNGGEVFHVAAIGSDF